jgi:hypothetical protein
MGIPRTPEKTLLFVGALFSTEDHYLEAYRALQKAFGEVIMETPPVRWDFSDHYKDEMGEPLFRRFLFFRDFVEPDQLPKIKLMTNDLEMKLTTKGKRNINLDPGYLTLAKIVLASTKDYSHRVYLKEGIFAEVTLIFSKAEGKFIPNINTYNDYKDERYLKFFLFARELFFLLNGNTQIKSDGL